MKVTVSRARDEREKHHSDIFFVLKENFYSKKRT